jgi:hypothetical protein
MGEQRRIYPAELKRIALEIRFMADHQRQWSVEKMA